MAYIVSTQHRTLLRLLAMLLHTLFLVAAVAFTTVTTAALPASNPDRAKTNQNSLTEPASDVAAKHTHLVKMFQAASDETLTFALVGGRDSKYCAHPPGGKMVCDRYEVAEWEKIGIRVENPTAQTFYMMGGPLNDKYCHDTGNGILCDMETKVTGTLFTAEDLPDDKFAIKSGRTDPPMYCTDKPADWGGLVCDTATRSTWEVFTLETEATWKPSDMHGVWALMGATMHYCANEQDKIVCDRPEVGGGAQAWEKFRPVVQEDGTFGLQSLRDGKFCKDEPDGVTCTMHNVSGAWEAFTHEELPEEDKKLSADKHAVYILGGRDHKYCADAGDKVICDKEGPDEATMFIAHRQYDPPSLKASQVKGTSKASFKEDDIQAEQIAPNLCTTNRCFHKRSQDFKAPSATGACPGDDGTLWAASDYDGQQCTAECAQVYGANAYGCPKVKHQGEYLCGCEEACHPGSSTVQMTDGTLRALRSVNVGDEILTPNGFEPVLGFLHQESSDVAPYFHITAANNATIAISASHYLVVDGEWRDPASVTVGQMLKSADGLDVAITAIEERLAEGQYHFYVAGGVYFVDGLLSTDYFNDGKAAPSFAEWRVSHWYVHLRYQVGLPIIPQGHGKLMPRPFWAYELVEAWGVSDAITSVLSPLLVMSVMATEMIDALYELATKKPSLALAAVATVATLHIGATKGKAQGAK